MCVFWSYPNMRETTVHPLPTSESSPAMRRLVLIRSPSPLSSVRPQPTPPAHFFFRDSWRSSCRQTGHQTSHPASSVMSPLIYMWHLPVLSRLVWICHTFYRRSSATQRIAASQRWETSQILGWGWHFKFVTKKYKWLSIWESTKELFILKTHKMCTHSWYKTCVNKPFNK